MSNIHELPLVSIVMATYNGEKFLKPQIQSILNQDYTNIEIIIIDDCSKDRTVELIFSFIENNPNIRLIQLSKNLGAVNAFEVGLGMAKGEYIALSDQDDIFDTNKISTMLDAFRKNKDIDLVISDLRLISESDQIITESMWKFQKMNPKGGKPFHQLAYNNFITGCACMITKRLLTIALPFPENCIIHDWWLSVLAASERCGGILLLPFPLISYRQHGINIIGAHSGGLLTAIKRAPNLHQRNEWYARNCGRIRGYLQYSGWNQNELNELRSLLSLFNGYAGDSNNSLLKRLSLLPSRLKYAMTHNMSHIIGIVIFSLVPKIVELLNSLLPSAKIGFERKKGPSC